MSETPRSNQIGRDPFHLRPNERRFASQWPAIGEWILRVLST